MANRLPVSNEHAVSPAHIEKTPLRILFLTTYFKPDITANGILMTQLAEELSAIGHHVTVVTSMPHYSTNRIWDEYRGKFWQREKQNGLDIHRVYLYVPSEKTNLVGRLLNYLSFNLFSLIVALWVGRHDVVFVPSPPLTNGLTGYLVKLIHRCKYVYNVQDIYPDVAVRLGMLTNPRAIKFFEKVESFVYQGADSVSVISQGFWKNLRDKKVPAKKLALIPNFVDADFIRPQPRHNAFSRKEGLDDRFVLLFAGNVGLSQALDKVLDAAYLLQDLPEILFLLVGNGSSKEILIAKAQKMDLQNVRFLPFQSHEDVPNMYASADACLVPLKRGLAQESVPSKAFSILGAGKPLIASVDSENDMLTLLKEANSGIVVEPENPEALAEVIRVLYHDRSQLIEMGMNGRRYIEAYCTKQVIAREYETLFQQVVNRSPSNKTENMPDPLSDNQQIIDAKTTI